MPQFSKRPSVIGNKLLSLSLIMSVVISPFAMISSAQADLSVFNEAYNKLAADNGNPLKAPTEQQKQFIKQTLRSAGMTVPLVSIQPSKLPTM